MRIAVSTLCATLMLCPIGAVAQSVEDHQLQSMSLSEIFHLYNQLNTELRARKVVRTANNPTGGLAEYLFVKAYGWTLAENSQKGFDATGGGLRYQIKGRRVHMRNSSRQLGAFRSFDTFDYLAAVIFDDDYQISTAALIPMQVVKEHATFTKHTNSYRFIFRDSILAVPGVRDVTQELRENSGYFSRGDEE